MLHIKNLLIVVGLVMFGFSFIVQAESYETQKVQAEPLSFDTVSGYLSLVLSNNGNYGNMGNNGDGRANLDFVLNGADCDTNASVYLYDASPFIGKIEGNDTIFYHSFRQGNGLTPNSFIPLGGMSQGSGFSYNWYSTGVFITPDSSIALEQTFYAPTAPGANYIIKNLKVWSHDSASHAGLRIGDVIDWDIPSDSGNWNSAAFNPALNLIYQQGAEFDRDDTLNDGWINPMGSDCVDQDIRLGGMAFIVSLHNDIDIPYSAYTTGNDSFVFPTGNLVAGELWRNMDSDGYAVDTSIEDMHMVMCYEPNLFLQATDTAEYYTVLVTSISGPFGDLETPIDNAYDFIAHYLIGCTGCCIGVRGNIDGGPDDGTLIGSIDIGDLVYLVAYMFQEGPLLICEQEADVNGKHCFSKVIIDISDLVYLVAFMFQDGPAPTDCG